MLEAATASREISPRTAAALYGYPHIGRISTGVHDPLMAIFTVLRSGGNTVVLGSLEVLMLPPSFARRLRGAVADAVDCESDAVFVSCTHTHSGPVTAPLIAWEHDATIPQPDPDYLEWLLRQAVEAAREAADNTTPSALAWATADATGVGGNRLSDEGVTDPECGVLALRDASTGAIHTVHMIYGMHPTVMHEDSTLVSADFPYYTRLHVQEHRAADVPVAYHMAPSGNQSPRRFVDGQTFAEAERLGRRLGAGVVGALDALGDVDWVRDAALGAALRQVEIPRNRIRPLEEAEELLVSYRARFDALKGQGAPRADVRTAECAVFGAEGTVALAQAEAGGRLSSALQEYSPADVQVLRIGEIALAGWPGEYFVEYGLELKRRAPRRCFAVSVVNGHLQGYIVTPAAAAQGGYEATNAVFAPDTGKRVIDASLELME